MLRSGTMRDRTINREGQIVSENERRAADTLCASDLVIRGASVVLLVVMALLVVLQIQPV
mgnify:CR=1 FL=1